MENVIEDEPAKEVYTPIRALNSFIPDWKIKARVTLKGPKKLGIMQEAQVSSQQSI